ncbi:MAG: DUF4411 family protein [Limisphaerales bacterium]
MAYLLDANTLIQAKNEYYGFDLCPGFWAWLEQGNAAGEVFSIDRIQQELERGNDELATWATAHGHGFFLPVDEQTNQAMAVVAAWVQNGNFSDNAKREFFSGADPFLIAHAMAHGQTVATHEVHKEGERRKVKIPTVCRGLNVPCVRAFEMLRQNRAVFVLAQNNPVA